MPRLRHKPKGNRTRVKSRSEFIRGFRDVYLSGAMSGIKLYIQTEPKAVTEVFGVVAKL